MGGTGDAVIEVNLERTTTVEQLGELIGGADA